MPRGTASLASRTLDVTGVRLDKMIFEGDFANQDSIVNWAV
jgi:hypothetical protein